MCIFILFIVGAIVILYLAFRPEEKDEPFDPPPYDFGPFDYWIDHRDDLMGDDSDGEHKL